VLIPTTCDYFQKNNKQLFWANDTLFSVRYDFYLDGLNALKEQGVYNKTDVRSVVSLCVSG